VSSALNDIFKAAMPSLVKILGERNNTVMTNLEGDDLTTTVIIEIELVPVGEYDERMERITTLECLNTDDATVGCIWTIDQDATLDDPYPDPVQWKAEQILSDDGITRKFLVRKVLE